jgi:6-phosphogluconolactonase (cycloisomerase 2 family)
MRSFRTLTPPRSGSLLAFGAACLLSLLTACGGGKSSPPAPTAPTIGTQPASVTVVAPATATFMVGASGTAPTYQWLKNGSALSGATAASYTTPATSGADDNATFTVTVSNSLGSVTSASATLHVNFVSILGQPTNQLASTGGGATFTVGATGPVGGTLHYQWKKGGVALAGATSANLSLTNVSTTDMAAYTCEVVSHLNGTVTPIATTTAATLAIVDAPSITGQPGDQTVIEGTPASFTVGATAPVGGTLSYQWKKANMAIAGATSATLVIPSVSEAHQGSYSCIVTNTQNGASLIRSTSPASLAVVGLPVITAQPIGATIFYADPLTLTTAATGNGTISYQWKKDGTAIAGATSQSYVIASAAFADEGAYTCEIANTKYGVSATATTQVANVVVQGAPIVTTQPANRSVLVGQSATFSLVAKGVTPFTYKWFKNGVEIPASNSDTYTTPATTLADHGAKFKCVVTNTFGSTTSDEVTLTVLDLLATFKASAQNLTVGEGVILTYKFRAGTTATLQIGSGTPVAVTSGGTRIDYPSANTTYTLAVTEAGVTTLFPLNVTVKSYTPKHFYVVNYGSNDIRRYPIDLAANTYVKAAVGSPVPTGTGPVHITTSPDEAYLYVANLTANSISAYSADATTGVLTGLGSTALSTYAAPWCSVVDPTGTRLYVACDNGIEVFTFNAGVPVAVPSLAYPIPGRVKGDLLMHPSGAYLFVLDNGHAKIKVYAIDPTTGALSFLSEAGTNTNPKGLVFDRAASLVFTRGTDDRTVMAPDQSGNIGLRSFNAAINVFSMDFQNDVLIAKSVYAGYGINQNQSDLAGQDIYRAFVPGQNSVGRHGLAFSRKPGVDQLFNAYTTMQYYEVLSQYDVDVTTGTILGDTPSPFLGLGSPYWIGSSMIFSAGGDSILGDRSGTLFLYPLPDSNQLISYRCDVQGRLSALTGGLGGEQAYATGTEPSHGCFRGTLQ